MYVREAEKNVWLPGTLPQVPTIDFDNADEFRRYVPGCPNENFAWRAYGQLEVVSGGNYNLCTTSDDGSMLYIDLTPGDKVRYRSKAVFILPDELPPSLPCFAYNILDLLPNIRLWRVLGEAESELCAGHQQRRPPWSPSVLQNHDIATWQLQHHGLWLTVRSRPPPPPTVPPPSLPIFVVCYFLSSPPL